MHLTRYTSSRPSLMHTFPMTRAIVQNINGYTHDESIIVCIQINGTIGVPISLYSILFAYYDPGTRGIDYATCGARPDILILYMLSRGKPLHSDYIHNSFFFRNIQVLDCAIENGLWVGSLDKVFVTACLRGLTDTVIKLLPHVDVHCHGDNGLYFACEYEYEDIVRILLDRDKYPVYAISRCQQCNNNSDTVKKLLRDAKFPSTAK